MATIRFACAQFLLAAIVRELERIIYMPIAHKRGMLILEQLILEQESARAIRA